MDSVAYGTFCLSKTFSKLLFVDSMQKHARMARTNTQCSIIIFHVTYANCRQRTKY